MDDAGRVAGCGDSRDMARARRRTAPENIAVSALKGRLTRGREGSSLVEGKMRFRKAIFVVALVASLAAYAVDCGAMTTPEQAMQCCKSMPCSSHGHQGKNCCKSMEAMHAPFVLAPSVRAPGVSVVAAEFPASTASIVLHSVIGSISAQHHSPPSVQSLSLSPLRI